MSNKRIFANRSTNIQNATTGRGDWVRIFGGPELWRRWTTTAGAEVVVPWTRTDRGKWIPCWLLAKIGHSALDFAFHVNNYVTSASGILLLYCGRSYTSAISSRRRDKIILSTTVVTIPTFNRVNGIEKESFTVMFIFTSFNKYRRDSIDYLL